MTTPQDLERAFYQALEQANLETMMALWSEDDEIVCVFPGGGRLCGYADIRAAWQRLFESGTRVRIHLSHSCVIQNPFTVIHNVVEHITPANQTEARGPVLATNVYVRGPTGWRIVVHHCSTLARTETEAGARAAIRPHSKTLH